MGNKVAMLAEYTRNLVITSHHASGYGILPSMCACKGKLDYISSESLKCRRCKREYNIDSLASTIGESND